MRILLLTKIFPPDVGGVPNFYWNLITNFSQINATVLTSKAKAHHKFDNFLNEKNIEIIRGDYFPCEYGISFNTRWIRALIKIVSKIKNVCASHKIDCIVVGQADVFLALVGYISKILTGKPYIIFLHNEEIPSVHLKSNFLLRFLYSRAKLFFCNSKFTVCKLRIFLKKEVNSVIINPGVEERFFEERNPGNAKRIKQELGLNNNTIIYTIARLDERKGQDMVIKSLPQVIKKYPDIIYLIGGEGPQRKNLECLVKENNIQEYVKFLGLIQNEDLVAFHQAGDIFIMANRTLANGDTEGFGIVFLEANAVGNPVIAGRSGGAVEAVAEGLTGLLVNPNDQNDIAEKICWLLDNKEKAEEMGERGRIRAWKEFRWKDLALNFEKILLSL